MGKSDIRWRNGIALVGNTVCGTIQKWGGGWYAYGCLNEWEDVGIGQFATQYKAKLAVNKWIRDNQ